MDLIDILRTRIDALPPGDYTPGLRAVLQHIQAACRHWHRGSTQGDETAFTDTIYRTNQVFEGSLKEAYRVLTGEDPLKLRPFEIENYLQQRSLLRPRVLAQFSNYRTEWRNPSAHDYRLDFDEDEALLAIVSVCGFAVVLVDQIAEKISYDVTKAATPEVTAPVTPTKPLLDVVADALDRFSMPASTTAGDEPIRGATVMGALAGYLSSVVPGAVVDVDPYLVSGKDARPDLVVTLGERRLLIEVKRGIRPRGIRHEYVQQVAHYVALSGIREALVYVYADRPGAPLTRNEVLLPGANARVVIMSPVQ